ncbi:MAG: cryptochrome/photolyase family protein, partial [Micrococcales bacterium]
VGGQWNFDHDNRLPPPKNYTWPAYLEHQRDHIDQQVAAQLDYQPTSTWATTRQGALAQLEYFVQNHLAGFGPYEDAVTHQNWALHHSLLSPYLNVGLLHASEVVSRVLEAHEQTNAPIASVEALIRQVIGWREYINGMYWFFGPQYRNENFLQAKRPLPPAFRDSSKTQMACVSWAVGQVEERAWTHHIPRLMILSNLALTAGVSPQEFLDWMREQFVDASDWVMVPNIIGMATFADGGKLMTKPYASGGAYLNRMTDHCKGCRFDPKLRVGENACPFTTLYWDFTARNRPAFEKNHRMFQALQGLNRLSDLPAVQARATQVLDLLDAGQL